MSGNASLPPCNTEAEEYVIGACLLSPRAIDACAEILQPGDFYRQSLERIWDAILALHGEGKATDALAVIDRLDVLGKLSEVGGKERVFELAAIVPATSNAPHHARIIRDMATLRGLTVVGEQIQRLGWDRPDETPALVDEAERLVFTLAGQRSRSDLRAVGDDMMETFARLQELAARGKQVVGVASGLMDLDRLTLGFHPGNLIVVGARPSLGKALALDSGVLTPTGFKRMGDIELGDEVIGADGLPDVVTGVFDQEPKLLYRVTTLDGASVECCDEHQWLTTTRNEQRNKHGGATVKTTAEIRRTVKRVDSASPNHSIPFVGTVFFAEQGAPPLDPYWLGLYLGDGESRGSSVRWTNPEPDLIEAFASLLPEGDGVTMRHNSSHCPCVCVKRAKRDNTKSETHKRLETLGVAGLGSAEKFIPECYLLSSVENRIALLQGICDTDGFVCGDGARTIEVSTASRRMREGIEFLVQSLGGRIACNEHPTHYRKDGVRFEAKLAHRLTLAFPNENCVPVRSKKHLAKFHGELQRGRTRRIVSVEPTEVKPCRCITVGRELYVTDGFIVTHNSSLALGFAAHVALRENRPVAFFTLEMTRHEVQQRLLSMEGSVDLPKLRNGLLDKEDWASVGRVSQALKDAPLFIEDDSAITMLELRGKARRLAAKHPDLALIVVDYLQLLTSGVKIESRTQEVSYLSRSLKLLAGELKVPVVALSQLNRQVEQRHDKRPLMSDLRESGGVESDADVILLLFRDDYYSPDDAELDGTAGICEVNIAKHRNGPTEMVKVAFAKRYARFSNLAR